MTELAFDVLDIQPDRFALAPTLLARLRIAETTGAVVHMMALQAQIRIEAHLRSYAPDEQGLLIEQFGEPERWNETLRSFTWTHTAVHVPGFSGSHELDLPIVASYDLEVLGSRYLHALADGGAPLEFLFNGTVLTRTDGDGFHVHQIPWHKAASYRLPVGVWRETMDRYFPNSGWVRLNRDTIEALQRFKGSNAIPGWDRTFTELLKRAGEPAP